MKNSLSVVIPFYGDAHLERFKIVAESILSQRDISLELIISGLNATNRVEDFADLDISNHKTPEVVHMGTIINRGLQLASGEFTYVTDADIMFPGEDYLSNLEKEFHSQKKFIKRSPMRRLLVEDFNWLYSLVKQAGLKKALASLDFSQEYIVKPTNTERPIRIFKKTERGRDKTFIISERDYQQYISDEKNKGSEPIYFNQERHCGAVFAPTNAFYEVGGYHERFISWGVWDADIQWKLEQLGGMVLIPSEKRFEVIHLDHLKGYFDKLLWESDRSLQEIRRKLGAERCIRQDLNEFGVKNAK